MPDSVDFSFLSFHDNAEDFALCTSHTFGFCCGTLIRHLFNACITARDFMLWHDTCCCAAASIVEWTVTKMQVQAAFINVKLHYHVSGIITLEAYTCVLSLRVLGLLSLVINASQCLSL